MPNIKFSYLYRDSGNYKYWGAVVFAYSGAYSLVELEAMLRAKLIDGTWFYADAWGLPELFPPCCDFRTEPTWHEFAALNYTAVPPDSPEIPGFFAKFITPH